MQPSEAREALDRIQAADSRLAEKIGHCPPWRHAAFGGMFALLIGSIAVSSAVQFATIPVILAFVVLMMRSDRQRLGVFINGYRRGATLPVTFVFVGLMIALVFFAMQMRVEGFSDWCKAGLAAIAFVMAILFSLKWQSVFNRELTGA